MFVQGQQFELYVHGFAVIPGVALVAGGLTSGQIAGFLVGVLAALVAAWPNATAGQGVSLAAIVAVATLVGAAQTMAVAIVGEYVVRTYREAQGRPTWVIRRTINGPEAAALPETTKTTRHTFTGDSRAA